MKHMLARVTLGEAVQGNSVKVVAVEMLVSTSFLTATTLAELLSGV